MKDGAHSSGERDDKKPWGILTTLTTLVTGEGGDHDLGKGPQDLGDPT
jgi:hypothetical protein